jgi:hypothetical protein
MPAEQGGQLPAFSARFAYASRIRPFMDMLPRCAEHKQDASACCHAISGAAGASKPALHFDTARHRLIDRCLTYSAEPCRLS